MKILLKPVFLSIFLGLMSAAWGNDFAAHQSGPWGDIFTWQEYYLNAWHWPATHAPTSADDGIYIGAGHTVTISGNLTVDQLTIAGGTLIISSGSTLTIADGPGVDLLSNNNGSFIRVDGTLVNNGQIDIYLGGLQVGTIVNNGSMSIGGIFTFVQGTITGNDLVYGPTGSIAINFPGYVVNQENFLWPSTNGPANVTIGSSVTLNGSRTISGSLKVYGTLEVAGDLTINGTAEIFGALNVTGAVTNNGSANASGTIEVSGIFTNNGTTQITGTVKIDEGGVASGNDFVYTGFSSELILSGSHSINSRAVFGSGTNTPSNVTIQYASIITLNVGVTVNGSFDINGTLEVADTLATNGTTLLYGTLNVAEKLINSGTIQDYGTLEVNGILRNNGWIQIYGVCQLAGALTNNGSTKIEGTFQLDQGGAANGNNFEYGVLYGFPNGTLVFNNSFGSLDVNSGAVYWPDTNGPNDVIVQGTGGITMNVARTVAGVFQTAAAVTNASNLTLSGSVQFDPGGSLDSSPVYSGEATLTYNSGSSYNVGAEWGSGTGVGSGVPMNIAISSGAVVNMPNGPRTCPGDLTLRGTLVLSTTPGADLSVGGDWYNDYWEPGTLIPNSRAVIFNGNSEQTVSGINTFDFLTVDNPAGISAPGFDNSEEQKADSITVSQSFTLVAGNMRLGQVWQSFLILPSTVNGASIDRHVVTYQNGRVVRSLSSGDSFQFPIGPTETSYNPLTIALNPADSTETFSVRVDTVIEQGSLNESLCVHRTWDIREATAGDNHAALTFQWSGAEEGANFIRDNTSTYLYNGDYAEVATNGAATGTDPYIVSTTGGYPITEFSQFVVATSGGITAVAASENEIPHSFTLRQNYPNPFNPSTTIRYSIANSQHVLIKVYDLLGREVATLVDQQKPAGEYGVEFDASRLSSGLYFYTIEAGNFRETKKMMLMR